MKVLITGGAGYIGSTVAWMFIDRGHKVTIIDSLITGKKTNLPKKSKFIKSDISDLNTLRRSLKENYDVVLHFAALIDNQESIKHKRRYLKNNYVKSKIFLNFCIKMGIKNFIFSSSAAVYGSSKKKVNEKSNTKPLAPYGKSKLKFERFLKNSKNKINYVILRYFNVIGVEKKMRCGFETKKNKSLINNICKSIVYKKNFQIFGNNFNTNDGTTVRDFIYVGDLSKVHYRFAKIITKKRIQSIFNCGYGKGHSVLEIVNKFNSTLKIKFKFSLKEKRKNDIGYSVADSKKLKKYYDFKNIENKLSIMIRTSFKWYKKKHLN